jgi:hypothetical protein
MEFIKHFEDIYNKYLIINLKGKLLKYYNNLYYKIIKALLKFKDKSKIWEDLVQALKTKFYSNNYYQTTYLISFLNKFIKLKRIRS